MSTESNHLRRGLQHTDELVDNIERNYNIKFSGVEEYEEAFETILQPGETLQGILEQWDPQQTTVLDFMGYGEVLHELGVRHGLAVALTDARDAERKEKHGSAITVVDGNILKSQTWHRIDEWLREQSQPDGFKMILARPVAGINTLSSEPRILYAMIDRLYRRLSDQNGTILFEGGIIMTEKFREWATAISSADGIDVRFYIHDNASLSLEDILASARQGNVEKVLRVSEALRITKHAGAPLRLPVLNNGDQFNF